MNQDAKKRAAAAGALDYIDVEGFIGVGTGSTANHFIDLLADQKHRFEGAVASSQATADRLRGHGIAVLELNGIGELSYYVDGADEATRHRHLVKGGGGALTREKIVAACSRTFVCIVDDTKIVDTLGRFPLPVEVIPMARSFVAREIVKLGGRPELRHGFITDNGNEIIDIYGLRIEGPIALEETLNEITGVVTNGIFAKRPADCIVVASDSGVSLIE